MGQRSELGLGCFVLIAGAGLVLLFVRLDMLDLDLCLPAPGDHGVSERIAERVLEGEGTTVDIAALTPFEWSRFYIFDGYTPEEMAEEDLGFHWRYCWSTSTRWDESDNFLVFVNDGKVVASFDHSRGEGDFGYLEPNSFPPDSARFVVNQRGLLSGGSPHLVLVPSL